MEALYASLVSSLKARAFKEHSQEISIAVGIHDQRIYSIHTFAITIYPGLYLCNLCILTRNKVCSSTSILFSHDPNHHQTYS